MPGVTVIIDHIIAYVHQIGIITGIGKCMCIRLTYVGSERLTHEGLDRRMDVLVLLQARRSGKGFATVRAGMCPRANML